MALSLIAAVAENNCIGKGGTLPWHLPEDLKRFKAMTEGKVVLMGRKTWESLPVKFRPLPNRTNVVITHQKNYSVPEGVYVFPSLEAALEIFSGKKVMVIGGAQLYATTINLADRLYITHVHQTVDGDAFFPMIDPKLWREAERDDRTDISFVTYQRV